MDKRRSFHTLPHEQARRVYDHIGAAQDTQAFYEDIAANDVVAHSAFENATSVFEFGCGTGRFAAKLLGEHLPHDARYRGADQSPVMAGLAEQKTARFGECASILLTDGCTRMPEPDGSHDRFVSNFVLDLLSDDDIRAVMAEAHRILRPGGLLCLASLSEGHGPVSKVVIGLWSLVHRLRPSLVAGCRPIRLLPFLDRDLWTVHHRRAMAPYGLPAEVVVAERRPN